MLTIVGRRVHLREFRAADARWLARAMRKGTWWRWDAPWEGPPAPAELRRLPTLLGLIARERVQPPRRMVIETRAASPIGSVSRYWVDERTQWLEVGIALYESRHWNKGYGSEALALWIDHLFDGLALRRVGLRTWGGNRRMIRVARGLGFQQEARFREAALVGRRVYDRLAFGLLRREWRRARTRWRAMGPA
ncbi:MAG: GNAT family N-acetyltransferase [Armatimonadota bacterium]